MPVGRVDGVDDGTDDFSTHSRLPTKSLVLFRAQQHFAVSQTPAFVEYLIHSEMMFKQIAL